MKIAMSGASGFVGGHLTRALGEKGWAVVPLVRGDFESGTLLRSKIEGVDVVVNLAGATIAARWTGEYKKLLYRSRIETTEKIVETMDKAKKKPGLFISTSAVGIYDSHGVHTEDSTRYADTFLGKLAVDWEKAALRAEGEGIRTVVFRFGVVLGPGGGVIQKMLTPFKMGLGGTLGDGKQAFSWIHIDDLVRAYIAAIEEPGFAGIYNLTAPKPTTNKGLTQALARALHKPAVMRVPFFALKLQLGEGAKAVLEGEHAVPKRLLEQGFAFAFTEIGPAVEDVVKRSGQA